ncbi:MAG: thioredoxin domain-containing protein [Pontiellaceae bacterium]
MTTKKTNLLIHEKSPYLLQHASNPVYWHPWGEAAFQKALDGDKPIFLSIGYSTCHWCHVMENESFEDPTIAKLLNDVFVCIKVDREERPDIDSIYMTVCQMMNGSGGWPLSLFLLPNQKPFHAATYIPPEQRYGRIGMKELIPRIDEMWKLERHKLEEASVKITDHLVSHQLTAQADTNQIDENIIIKAEVSLLTQFDKEEGGFGQAPKFPTAHRLLFLLRSGNTDGINAALYTLEKMRLGGLFDQVGYGFHRYATDREWLLPHFEKMLYDQALLIMAYIEAYRYTNDRFYENVIHELITYVIRDMNHPEGGFYTAEDADSEGEEGIFYVWEKTELDALLGSSAEWINQIWNIQDKGNFREESSGTYTGRNIPHLKERFNKSEADQFSSLRKILFKEREKRVHPFKDTKVLTDWNGLMIAALAKAGRSLQHRAFVHAAEKAVQFVDTYLTNENGKLWHRWRDGEAIISGTLEDYVFYINGLLELYDSTLDLVYLAKVVELAEQVEGLFKDEKQGGYFMTSQQVNPLIVRPKEIYDGAIPSGNSMHLDNLFRIARLTGDPKWEKAAVNLYQLFEQPIKEQPLNFMQALLVFQGGFQGASEIVIVGNHGLQVDEWLKWLQIHRQSSDLIIHVTDQNREQWGQLANYTKSMICVDGKPSIYICQSFECKPPVFDLDALNNALNRS